MADKETGLDIVLALLHQPIKFVHFHIGPDFLVLAMLSGIFQFLIQVKLKLQYSV